MTDDRPSELTQQILELEAKRDRLQTEIAESQEYLARFMQDSLGDLDRRRQALQLSVDQLERRQIRIQDEMKETFSGSSQDIAIRVQRLPHRKPRRSSSRRPKTRHRSHRT